MVKKLRFKISPEGEVTVSVEGASGNECENFSAPFEKALGTVAQKTFKDSYYQESSQDTQTTSQEEM